MLLIGHIKLEITLQELMIPMSSELLVINKVRGHDDVMTGERFPHYCPFVWRQPTSDCGYPDNKVHGANMVPIWGRQDPGGPHVDPMNFALWVFITGNVPPGILASACSGDGLLLNQCYFIVTKTVKYSFQCFLFVRNYFLSIIKTFE